MTKINFDELDLDSLIDLDERLQHELAMRREQSAAELRRHIEDTATKLGMSVKELVNGTASRRRRKHDADETTDGGEPS